MRSFPSSRRFAIVLVLGTLAFAMPLDAQDAAGDTPRSEQEEARRARIYARIGDTTLSVGDIEDAIAEEAAFRRQELSNAARLRDYAEGLLRQRLYAREAERRGFGDNPVVSHAYKEALGQNLLRQEIDERITRESITDEEIAAFYEANRADFERAEMRRAAHILFDTEEAAQAVLEEARAADAREFRNLVRTHSLDTETKYRGGDLRFFFANGRTPSAERREAVHEEGEGAREDDPPVNAALVEAAFALETLGDVSAPVAIDERFSLVKLTGLRPAERRTLEDAGESIRLRVWREKRREAIDTFIRSLRRDAEIEIDSTKLRLIHLDPAPEVPGFPGHGRAPENVSAMEASEAPSEEPPAGE